MLVAQSGPTLCNTVHCSLPGFSAHHISQARRLEWVAIHFSRGIFPTPWSNLGLLHYRQILYHLSHLANDQVEFIRVGPSQIWLYPYACLVTSVMSDSFAALWTVVHQAPPSMEFSRQEYKHVLPCPPPGDLPDPGIKPVSPVLQVDSLPLTSSGKPISS